MSLNRTKDNRILCTTCIYDADDSCNFAKRPNATSCTLYQDIKQAADASADIAKQPLYALPWWRKVNRVWLALGLLIAISLLVTLL